MEEQVLYRIRLGKDKPSTGKTRHYKGKDLLPDASEPQIVSYDHEIFYLFYLDEAGYLITDTFHESLEKAFQQAEFEYSVPKEDWQRTETH